MLKNIFLSLLLMVSVPLPRAFAETTAPRTSRLRITNGTVGILRAVGVYASNEHPIGALFVTVTGCSFQKLMESGTQSFGNILLVDVEGTTLRLVLHVSRYGKRASGRVVGSGQRVEVLSISGC